MFGLGKKKKQEPIKVKENDGNDNGEIEIWTNKEIKLNHNELIEYYCINMNKPNHNYGQWLVSELAIHEQSNNKSFHGFPRLYRCKFKPLPFRYKNIIMNPETHPAYKLFVEDDIKAKAEAAAKAEEAKLLASTVTRANSPSKNTRNNSPSRSSKFIKSKNLNNDDNVITKTNNGNNTNQLNTEKKYDIGNITNTNFAIWSKVVQIYNDHRLHLFKLYPPEPESDDT